MPTATATTPGTTETTATEAHPQQAGRSFHWARRISLGTRKRPLNESADLRCRSSHGPGVSWDQACRFPRPNRPDADTGARVRSPDCSGPGRIVFGYGYRLAHSE